MDICFNKKLKIFRREQCFLYFRGGIFILIMRSLIVAREKEQAMLGRLLEEPTAQFLAVYGRRRIGKTFLIREYFDDNFAFRHTAVSPLEFQDKNETLLYKIQLEEFAHSLEKYGAKIEGPLTNWFDAFHKLEDLLDRKRTKKKMVVFIDEMPWLDTAKSGFMSAFEHFWNDWGCAKHNLLLIACSSASTWMLDKLINNKGGLYGRTNREMHMHPFTLNETERYFKSRNIAMDRYDIVQTYMIMGGVAYYISFFEPGKSLSQNIDEVFFSEGGFLLSEYERLFTSLFANNGNYKKIVETLAGRRYGATREQISNDTGISAGGNLSDMLKTLVKSDLVTTYYNFGETKRNLYYKLTDMFCLFYLGFVSKNPTNNPHFWQDNQTSPKLNRWRGISFEDVCFVHQEKIRAALGISGVQAEIYPWRSTPDGEVPGAQIDMLIDRADRVMNLCEMKFTQGDFTIDKDYDEKLRNKITALLAATRNKKNIHPTLVTTYGLKVNMYSNRIQRVVTMDDLF
ncbi:MAG: AAA family ATPase [Bacteroidaceae bacterium]|nr:AAA family ATPase [Bacteroidaceae bacterium]